MLEILNFTSFLIRYRLPLRAARGRVGLHFGAAARGRRQCGGYGAVRQGALPAAGAAAPHVVLLREPDLHKTVRMFCPASTTECSVC